MNNETKPHQSPQEQRPPPSVPPTVDLEVDLKEVDLEEDLPELLVDVADLWNLPSANENHSTVPGTVFNIAGHTQESIDHFFSGQLMTMSYIVVKGKCEMCVKITELRRNKRMLAPSDD